MLPAGWRGAASSNLQHALRAKVLAQLSPYAVLPPKLGPVYRPAQHSTLGWHARITVHRFQLAEFGSAVAAAQAAIDIQEHIARFNEGLAEDQRRLFRIGVHLGEIIIIATGHDIFGDGVNLAERI